MAATLSVQRETTVPPNLATFSLTSFNSEPFNIVENSIFFKGRIRVTFALYIHKKNIVSKQIT